MAIEVNAPVRGASLRTTRFAATERPAFDFLTSLRSAARPAGGLRIEADVAAALERAAVLVPRNDAPRAVRYACYIDHHGQPQAAAPRAVGTPLIVNPSLRVLQGTGAFSAPWTEKPGRRRACSGLAARTRQRGAIRVLARLKAMPNDSVLWPAAKSNLPISTSGSSGVLRTPGC